MRVLWITGTVLPEASYLLSGKADFKTSGGWIVGAAKHLCENESVELFIATGTSLVKDIKQLKGKLITYFLFPVRPDGTLNSHKDKVVLNALRDISAIVKPDVVHIHGTEHSLGLAYVNSVGNKHVVVSIQGLIGVIANYYDTGISLKEKLYTITIRDLLTHSSIFSEQRNFRKRGRNEKELLSRVKHVIGRTSFDKSHTWILNPEREYHFCNETLRDVFYHYCWSYDNCEKHSIFLSQANYPVKGFHFFLKALPYVINKYPDTKVYVAGPDINRKNDNLIKRIMIPGYWKLLRRLIKDNGFSEVITFTGPLDEEEMKERLLKANLFVSPSTIENSPNSLGEAQLVGTPCLASYVGGVPDFIKSDACGKMYRCEDVAQLASDICDLFESSPLFDNSVMRNIAMLRHNSKNNNEQLLKMYSRIIKSNT